MTTVYGVTRHGAHLQILKQLKDLPDFPQDKCWIAASYLAHKTFQSLQQMFTATKEIQVEVSVYYYINYTIITYGFLVTLLVRTT